jgi:Tol biopolymer transport system component
MTAVLLTVSFSMPVQATGITTLLGVGDNGQQPNDETKKASLSDDGRFAVFESDADNLVAEDGNEARDVFLHDRLARTVERVSLSSNGDEANGDSDFPKLSPDATLIAFDSFASNLVENDTNNSQDVFLKDLETGIVELVSVSSTGEQGNGDSSRPEMSADGRYVVFRSAASNLVSGDTNNVEDVFVRDRQLGFTTRVSVSTTGAEANDESGYYGTPISRDGRIIAFRSVASNLVLNDTNAKPDVFVHDRETGETTRISVSTDGVQGNSGSHLPAMNTTGRFIGFYSYASSLAENDTNFKGDAFVHDRNTGRTVRVSVSAEGVQGDGHGSRPVLSADGRYVAFASSASNMIPDDTNGWRDIFFKDLATGKVTRISVDSFGNEGNHNIDTPFMTPDARFISFEAYASNFVDNDINPGWDLFMHDRYGALCRGEIPTWVGTLGDDVILGTEDRDVIHGLDGNDLIIGKSGADIICGGRGQDEIRAGLGTTDVVILDGGDGDDVLRSGGGNDFLVGGAGVDDCDGGTGTDQAWACELQTGIP